MELTNAFRVSVSPADAWKVLTDAERIAPMLPGAQLQEIEDDEFRGLIKVKVGPITAQYKGTASWVERDETAGRAVLKATGRDTRGQGNASATITATMVPDGEGTRVEVVTDLTITGKVAQFGRGVLADVSGKLIGQFVDTLEADLKGERREPSAPKTVARGAGSADDESASATSAASSAQTPAPAPAGAEKAGAESAGDGQKGAEPAGDEKAGDEKAGDEQGAGSARGQEAPPAGRDVGATSSAPSGPRRIDHPEPEPVDLLDAAGGSVAKRLAPIVGGIGALAVLYVVLRRLVRR
jgi:carbon monoxide dehydrogenase subunit G